MVFTWSTELRTALEYRLEPNHPAIDIRWNGVISRVYVKHCCELKVYIRPKFIYWNFNSHCNGNRMWDLWDEGGALMNDISAFILRRAQKASLFLSYCMGTQLNCWKSAIWKRALTSTQPCLQLDLRLPTSRLWKIHSVGLNYRVYGYSSPIDLVYLFCSDKYSE